MKRREFGLLGVSAAALSAMQATAFAAPAAEAHSHNTGGCAEACSDCQRECDACAHHCAMMLADGHKHHLATLQTCQDCADICATASQVVSREGVMSELICQACADACAKVRQSLSNPRQRRQDDDGLCHRMRKVREGLPRHAEASRQAGGQVNGRTSVQPVCTFTQPAS